MQYSLKCLWKDSWDCNEWSFDISYQGSQRKPACLSSQGLAEFVRDGGASGQWDVMDLGVTSNHMASVTISPGVDIKPPTKLQVSSAWAQGFTPKSHYSLCGLWTATTVSVLTCSFSLAWNVLNQNLHVYKIPWWSLGRFKFEKLQSRANTKVHIVKTMVFPVVMSHRCESWTIKKAECWRIDAFELWCWRKVLRVPWTARRSNQWILKEINPEYLLEGLVPGGLPSMGSHRVRHDWSDLAAAAGAETEVPIPWPPAVKSWLIRKDLDARKDWGQEKGATEDEMVGWHHRLNGHESEQTPGDSEGQGSLECCSSWGHRIRQDLATEQEPSRADRVLTVTA